MKLDGEMIGQAGGDLAISVTALLYHIEKRGTLLAFG
jgi:hypothetical protein